MSDKKAWWVIRVGGGYGAFVLEDTEKKAEEMRTHKARWEGAVAHKFRCDGIVPAKILLGLLDREEK